MKKKQNVCLRGGQILSTIDCTRGDLYSSGRISNTVLPRGSQLPQF
jgi:hypothetical protein